MQESGERKLLTYNEEQAPTEPEKLVEEQKEEPVEPEQEPEPEPEQQQLQPLQTTGDLLVVFSMSFYLAHFCSSPLNLSFLACMIYADQPG
jgi:hypothetical protein